MNPDLRRIRVVADYQFGHGAGEALFPNDVHIIYSKNTKRIRHIYLGGGLQATLRPTDGVLTLTIAAARRLVDKMPGLGYIVEINDDAAEFVSQGKNVFAKHVTHAGEGIRPGDEVIIINGKMGVIGVGKALLLAEEMKTFKIGVAVKIRRGSETNA